jgi:TetR/AcrR family transcriptional regulator, transcriptional repressor for nem operon
MPRDGTETRTLIMDAAQELILQHGFAGTSVDAILERVSLTKGAFFHHFRSKGELAQALIERFAAADEAVLRSALERSERLTRDPVQRLLLFVSLLEEQAAALIEPYPGCLFASFCHEAQLFDEDVHGVIRAGFEHWQAEVSARVRAAMAHRPPRLEVSPDDVAAMLTAVVEGAFILSRSLNDAALLARQLRHYRNYLELLFGDP